ncbi:hypothetical protein WJX77_012239 [Trebouxia sp. C0004]
MSCLLHYCIAVCCALLLFQASEVVGQSKRVLVLLDDTALKSTHSLFFSSLTARGYQLTYSAASAPDLSIKDWDNYLYDKVIVFASSTSEFGGSLDATGLLDFVDAGHDLFLAIDPDASDELRELAADLGVDFDTKGSVITDHFNRHDQQQSAIVTRSALESKSVFGNIHKHAPVIYRGIGASVSPKSTLVVKALTAADTAYSAVPSKGTPDSSTLAGKDATLVALVQARNNARAVVAGSIDMFSNEFFRSTLGSGVNAGNEAFCTEATKWGFHERGVLLLTNMSHHLVGEHEQLTWYRVSDDIDFSVNIQELVDGQWQPFKANDVQVEFTMLDPHVRATLKPDNKGQFSTRMKVPDVYGVFKFVISYHRLGYTSIEESWQVSVRPFKHNEYERFLLPAYPYYASAFSMMFGFYALGFFFLYHK